ncbi:hypothetical protein [Sorangium sp. So ce1151]|uniref:type IV secretory system conjugative DNA transfer family protein n=1 Tax=Sorangium sp. So ce1151 TaxID=3133332 RepID=UPI003F5F1545
MHTLSKPSIVLPQRKQLDLGAILRRSDEEQHPESLTLSDHVLRHHMLIRGASGGGKSQLLKQILWSNILRGYFCCFIDPVGSVVPPTLDFLGALMLKLFQQEHTAYAGWNEAKMQARLAWARQFVILNFTDPDIGGWRYNPLQPQDGLTVDETVGDFLRCLERVIGDLVEMRRLQMVLRAVLTLVARLGGATLRDAVEFLCMDTENIHAYLARLEERRRAGRLSSPVRQDLVQQYMSEFFANTSGRERRELVQSSFNALSIILSDAVAYRFVSSPDSNVSFSGIVNGGKWLLVHLPTGLDLNTQKVLGSMIVNRVQLIAERRSSTDVESGRVPPFSLMVDEFQTMMGRHWAEAIARVRNKNLNLVVAHQNSTQPPFETPEGQALLRAIEANASTHVYFRLHIDDAERAAVPVFRPRGHRLKREEVQVSETSSVSWAETVSKSITRSISDAFGESDGFSTTISIGQSQSVGFSQSNGVTRVETDTHSLARGSNWSRATSKADGTTVTVTDSETVVEGSGKSQGYTRGRSSSVDCAASSLSSAVNSVVSESESLARGKSHSLARSESETKSSSEGGSATATSGSSLARGLSQVKSCMDSLARTVSIAEAIQHTKSQTVTHSVSAGSSVASQRGGSYSRGTTRIREYYSVTEEVRIRAYELAELPRREAWVWINDAESMSFKIRTHDTPQSFVTRLGGRDFKAEFLSLAAPSTTASEPTESLIERSLGGRRRSR